MLHVLYKGNPNKSLIRGYIPHSTQSSLKKIRGGRGGGGWRVRLSPIANQTPSDAEFLDEAELLDLGGWGGGEEMEWGRLSLTANPTPKGGRISGGFLGGGGWQALSDNHLNT